MVVRIDQWSPVQETIEDPLGEPNSLGFRLIVSPGNGRLRHLPPARFDGGREWVTTGQAVAVIEQGSVAVEVRSPIDGRVAGILVRDGEPVATGQPLVWLDDAPLPESVRTGRGSKDSSPGRSSPA